MTKENYRTNKALPRVMPFRRTSNFQKKPKHCTGYEYSDLSPRKKNEKTRRYTTASVSSKNPSTRSSIKLSEAF